MKRCELAELVGGSPADNADNQRHPFRTLDRAKTMWSFKCGYESLSGD